MTAASSSAWTVEWIARAVEEHLLAWILLAVALGVLLPGLASITRVSTLILAVMVGSVSLTITLVDVRAVSWPGLATILTGHALMPVIALALSRLLGLSPELTAGFVLLGAVTPELVTPTMTALADGDTALAGVALVAIGALSLVFIPAITGLLLGDAIPIDPWRIVRTLLLAVVIPMAAAITLRERWGDPVSRYQDYYGAISALMVILIIGGVTAANASLFRAEPDLLLPVAIGALALNLAGYGLGWTTGMRFTTPTRIATTLSIGMRDFAVAAGLVVAAGFPPAAALPAVVFGVVEMATSAGLVRVFKN